MILRAIVIVFLLGLIEKEILAAASRQKRCIVIQKQSGSHGESSETDDDDEYRRPQPKAPSSDRLTKPGYADIEKVPPELLKYRAMPMKFNNEFRLRKRLLRNYSSHLPTQ